MSSNDFVDDCCNGDDLLKVFNDLHINLLNINPNLIKAWFDTDDQQLKEFLNWMTISLTPENYVSPLYNKEYLDIKEPLTGKYDNEKERIEEMYPELFESDVNELEIEFLSDEIDLLLEEEKRLDENIKINQYLHQKLSNEMDDLKSLDLKITSDVKVNEDLCHTLAAELDNVTQRLHSQLQKYGSNLYEYEFSSAPMFITNMDIGEFEEKFEIINCLSTILLDNHNTLSNDFMDEDRSSLGSNSNNSLMTNTLTTLRNRIFHSHQNLIISRIEVEKYKEVMNYCLNTDEFSFLSMSKNLYSQTSKESKEQSKRKLCGILENMSVRFADHHLVKTKLKYAQQELKGYQSMLKDLEFIENTEISLLVYFNLNYILCAQEKDDTESMDKFFRKILQYIGKDLKNCKTRTEKVENIINEHKKYCSEANDDKFKLFKAIYRIHSNDSSNFSLEKTFEVVDKFDNENSLLEERLFDINFGDYKKIATDVKTNIKTLQKFLICGPTKRTVVLNPELQIALVNVKNLLDRQNETLKSAVREVFLVMKKSTNKWENYLSQLWMYFLVKQDRLMFILEEIKDEFKEQQNYS